MSETAIESVPMFKGAIKNRTNSENGNQKAAPMSAYAVKNHTIVAKKIYEKERPLRRQGTQGFAAFYLLRENHKRGRGMVSRRVLFLSNQTMAKPSLVLGGITVKGHI